MSNVFNFVDTWTAAGTTYSAILCNITNTASAADSTLIHMQISGVTKFKIGLTGLIPSPAVATTLASAATIAPVNPIHFVSGTVSVVTITAPPLISATGGSITLIPTGAFAWTAAGNIALAGTAIVGQAVTFSYDVTAVKWYPTVTGSQIGLRSTSAVAPTIASAGTIAPTTPIAFVSGVAAIATITAPSPIAATGGTITIIPTGVFTWSAAGNIALAGTAVVSKALTFSYDQATAKWYPSYT